MTVRQPNERTLTENVSSLIKTVVFSLLVFLLLLFFCQRKYIHLFLLRANVDLSIIVERLLADPWRWCCHWFRDKISDVLVVKCSSQKLRPHLGVWDGCGEEEETDETCGTSIMSGKDSILPGLKMRLSSCILQLLFLSFSMQMKHFSSIHCTQLR